MANMQAVDYRALDGSEPVDEFIEGLSDARKQAALDAEEGRGRGGHDRRPPRPAPSQGRR
jgi:hypothetical protein